MICKISKICFEEIKTKHSQTNSISLENRDLVSSLYTIYHQYWNETQTMKMKFHILFSKENQFL